MSSRQTADKEFDRLCIGYGFVRGHHASVRDVECRKAIQQYLYSIGTTISVDVKVDPWRTHVSEYPCRLRALCIPIGCFQDGHELVGVEIGLPIIGDARDNDTVGAKSTQICSQFLRGIGCDRADLPPGFEFLDPLFERLYLLGQRGCRAVA